MTTFRRVRCLASSSNSMLTSHPSVEGLGQQLTGREGTTNEKGQFGSTRLTLSPTRSSPNLISPTETNLNQQNPTTRRKKKPQTH